MIDLDQGLKYSSWWDKQEPVAECRRDKLEYGLVMNGYTGEFKLKFNFCI